MCCGRGGLIPLIELRSDKSLPSIADLCFKGFLPLFWLKLQLNSGSEIDDTLLPSSSGLKLVFIDEVELIDRGEVEEDEDDWSFFVGPKMFYQRWLKTTRVYGNVPKKNQNLTVKIKTF